MGNESIAPYWVEDIERVRADLDEIDKKRNPFHPLVLWSSWRSGEHLQGSCVRHVRRQDQAVRCPNCQLYSKPDAHVPQVRV